MIAVFPGLSLKRKDDLYVYEYISPDKPKEPIWVAWSPTGSQREVNKTILIGHDKVIKAERMPLKEGAPEDVSITSDEKGAIDLKISESPVYIWLKQ